MRTVRRGYLPEYDRLFDPKGVAVLKEAAFDAVFLLDRGYRLKMAVELVQKHYQLEEPQRVALVRGLASTKDVVNRSKLAVSKASLAGHTVYMDGFNAIIPMESLISGSPIFKCMDGAIRDLANLRGSYHIIDKTEAAIRLILNQLDQLHVAKAVINIDSPVSNSRRLKVLILELARDYHVEVEVNLVDSCCDKTFYGMENVISGDCIVIDYAKSWVPLYAWIVEEYAQEHDVWLVDFQQFVK